MTIASETSAEGWSLTPRAQAEPRLNAWAATLLRDPKLVRIRVQFTDAQGASLSIIEIGLDSLQMAPLDLLSLPEARGVPQDLIDRIRRVVAQGAPAGTSQVVVLTDRDAGWKPQVIALTEWLKLLQVVSRLVNGARPLSPKDLVVQGDSSGTIDAAELQSRTDTAEQQMRAALASLQNFAANDASLLAAGAFGVVGATPNTDSTKWPAQIAAATVDLTARASQLDQLAAGFTRASSTPEQSGDYDLSRLKAIFGGSFQALPLLSSNSDLWANSSSLQANDPLESVRWFQRAARVRPGAARLDNGVMLAEALSGQLLQQFQVAQLPAVAADKWLALPNSASSSHLSLVTFSPAAIAAGASFAGLMIDEWTEVLPSSQQITGLSFQYNDPVGRPPQSILLAVRPDDFPEWTMEAVEGSVLEALDLAKIRAVDPDSLGALGHYLPALYFAYNTGAPQVETVSIDFNSVLKTTTEVKA